MLDKDAGKCCENRNKSIIDLRRGEKVGRRTAQVVNRLNRQSNKNKMPEWKAEQVFNRNKDIATSWSASAVRNMGNLTPASREINTAIDANRSAHDRQTAQIFRNALGFSSARADKTKTRR